MRNAKHAVALAALTVISGSTTSALAASYTWSAGPGTALPWSTSWTPAGYPSAAADTASIGPLAGNLTTNIDVTNSTLGLLTFGSGSFSTDIGNANSTGNALVFNNTGGTGNALIVTNAGTGANSITAPIFLAGNTDFGSASLTSLAVGSITASGGARQINNNAGNAGAAQTLTINGTLFSSAAGNTNTTSGLVINGSGNATINNGNVVVNGAFSLNGAPVTLGAITIGTASTVNNLVRSTVTLNADNSAFAANITLSRANTVLTSDLNTGTGRLLLGGATNSIDAFVSSSGGTRTINNAQLQIQQFNAFTGTNSFVINSKVIASASRGLGNLLTGNGTLTLNNGIYSANAATDLRNQILDGSGSTIVNNGLHNGYDQTNNVEFATATGSYEKRGTGVVTVNGSSTYTGGTRVRGGSLEFATSAAYGIGPAVAGNGITIDAGGVVGLLTGSLNQAFLDRIALGGGTNYSIPTIGATTSTVSTDFSSNGALALTNNDTSTAINYGSGGNFGSAALQTMGIGAVSAGANYAGTITPAASTYRLGGGGTLTLTNPSGNQLTGANSLVANNGGTVVLQGSNNYTGTTTIGGAYINPSQELLRLGQTTSVVTNNVTLRANSVVSVSSLANGGAASAIGSSNNAASNLVLNGGTLQYTGGGASTDRLFTIQPNGATLDASGTGAVNFTNTGAIALADAPTRTGVIDSGATTKNILYVNDVSDLSVGMGVTGTGITAGTTIKAIVPPSFSNIGGTTSVGPYQIILSAQATAASNVFTTVPDLAFTGQNRTLNLTGTSTAANTLGASVGNSATGTTSLAKTGAGTWVLTNSNTYTGSTTVSGGTLQLGDGTTGHDGTITASTGVALSNNATLAFNRFGSATAPYVISGSGGIAKTGVGTQVLTGSNTYTGSTSVNGGTLRVSYSATAASAATPLLTNAAGTDIRNGAVAFDYTGSTTPAATIRSLLASSFTAGGGIMTGGQIRSSGASATRGIGYADDGVSQVKVQATLFGDADLDGGVSINDFNALSANFGKTGKIWTDGDFDYDGGVSINDFNALAANFGKTTQTASDGPNFAAVVLWDFAVAHNDQAAFIAATGVPEPTTLGLLAGGAVLGLRRRRRA